MLSDKFSGIFKNSFLQNISGRLLLVLITVFPLISAPGENQILKLSDAALIRGRPLFQSYGNAQMLKLCHFFFQNKNEYQIYTINKTNIMKKTKYQQYFHCCYCLHTTSICILVQLLVEYGNYSNKSRIWWPGTYQRKRLFQCGYLKMQCLLEDDAYLRPGAYQRKYVMPSFDQIKSIEYFFRF